MLSCTEFNTSLAYPTLYLHVCAGSQWISDVFAATHVLRMPGTGFLDVWLVSKIVSGFVFDSNLQIFVRSHLQVLSLGLHVGWLHDVACVPFYGDGGRLV